MDGFIAKFGTLPRVQTYYRHLAADQLSTDQNWTGCHTSSAKFLASAIGPFNCPSQPSDCQHGSTAHKNYFSELRKVQADYSLENQARQAGCSVHVEQEMFPFSSSSMFPLARQHLHGHDPDVVRMSAAGVKVVSSLNSVANRKPDDVRSVRTVKQTTVIENQPLYQHRNFAEKGRTLTVTSDSAAVTVTKYRGKRVRTSFTPTQLLDLEQEYRNGRYLTQSRRLALAAYSNLDEQQVKIWFQNRRMKSKRTLSA